MTERVARTTDTALPDVGIVGTCLGVDAALHYAALGWPVLPVAGMAAATCTCGSDCDSPAKHPLTRHGVHDASTDHARIRRWWRRWPVANIGVATGATSGIAVVDVDPGSGGRRSLDAVRAAGHGLPPTRVAFSGGGGFHLFYRVPEGVRVANTVGRLPGVAIPLPGIDLRGDGGYIVVAPSTHLSGRRYRWSRLATELVLLPRWLWLPPPAPAPIEVVSHARRSGASAYGSAALASELEAVRRLVVGERNHGLNRAAFCLGQLVGGGELASDLVHRELLTAALSTGLSESEASRTIRSGLGAGEQQPRRAPKDSARGRASRRTEGAEGGGG